MEGNQVISQSSVFYVMQKDCKANKQQKTTQSVGNVFILNPFQQEKSILISDTSMLQIHQNF